MKKNCQKFMWMMITVILGVGMGCQPPSTSAQSSSHDDHGDSEESHEHFPAHWPYTIFRASARLAELAKNPDTASTDGSIAPREEFVDLVNWLPILAADSDLDRPTFDRIDAWSTSAMARWQRPGGLQELKNIVQESETQEMIAWLADVCRQEELRLEQLK